MTTILTGAAGFIGYHVAEALLARGESVLGIDDLNPYYDPRLKHARLDRLKRRRGFDFIQLDVSDSDRIVELAAPFRDSKAIIHLAAQAGVRHSLTAPFDYTRSNITGHLAMLELARRLPKLEHFVYASSSSVYGGNVKIPFAVTDRVDSPISLYAATKRAGELMSHAYSHLFGMPTSGLRFFSVYGPWGRPDMAAYLFASAIVQGKPIRLFNHGDMWRDFTFIDDIVAGVVAVLDRPPISGASSAPARVLNIGNNRPEPLARFVAVLEAALGQKATVVFEPMQPGDVRSTKADIEDMRELCGFQPTIGIDEGIPRFVSWFRSFHGLQSEAVARPKAAATS